MASSVLTDSLGVGAAPTQFSPPETIRPAAADSLYEIVNGQRLELLTMSAYATWLASRLVQQIGPYSEQRLLGTSVTEMLFVLDKARDLRRRPDVAFVSTERWSPDREFPLTGDWEVVPDLAVEVVSPNDLASDLLAKIHEYFQYGVRLVWVIYPDKRQVYVYDSPKLVRVLSGDEDLEGGDILPGFRWPLSKLFQESKVSPPKQ